MKTLVSIIVGLVVAYLIFFQLDPWIINTSLDGLNITEASDNYSLIKFAAWALVLIFSTAITLIISVVSGMLTRAILN